MFAMPHSTRWISLAACILAAMISRPLALAAEKKKEPAKQPWELITDKQIDAITYEDAEDDLGFVTPLAPDLSNLDDDTKKRLDEFADKLDTWEPGDEKELGQQVRNWMCLCTFADLGHSEFEAEIPYVVFDRLKKDLPKEKLKKALAWVILKPDEGKAVLSARDLGFEEPLEEAEVRERAAIYAKKLLGRLVGKLPPKEQ
jgi:hypothetical protein